jgi:hypothetical protein
VDEAADHLIIDGDGSHEARLGGHLGPSQSADAFSQRSRGGKKGRGKTAGSSQGIAGDPCGEMPQRGRWGPTCPAYPRRRAVVISGLIFGGVVRSPFQSNRSPFHSVTGIMPGLIVRDRVAILRALENQGDCREIGPVAEVGFDYFSCRQPPPSDIGFLPQTTGNRLQTDAERIKGIAQD